MADETTKPAVTDSRFPGFNTEVEESKAAEAAAAAKPAPAKPEPQAAAPVPRKPIEVVNDLEARVRSEHGSHPWLEELIAELKSVL
jgi:uncharacterized protein YbbK (DUF523 family)